jgi:hypothetical protein
MRRRYEILRAFEEFNSAVEKIARFLGEPK